MTEYCELCDFKGRKTKRAYSDTYDAYYCPHCLYWLERICPDRECEFCSQRPKYPKENVKNA